VPGEEGPRFIGLRCPAIALRQGSRLLIISLRPMRAIGRLAATGARFGQGALRSGGIANHVGHPPALHSFLQPSRQNDFVPTAWEMVLEVS
jgi:hypothetical protein